MYNAHPRAPYRLCSYNNLEARGQQTCLFHAVRVEQCQHALQRRTHVAWGERSAATAFVVAMIEKHRPAGRPHRRGRRHCQSAAVV